MSLNGETRTQVLWNILNFELDWKGKLKVNNELSLKMFCSFEKCINLNSDSYYCFFSFICLLPLQVLCTSLGVPTPANPPCSMLSCPQIIASLRHEISSKELQSVSGQVRTYKNNKMRPTLAQCHDEMISIKKISIEMGTRIFHLHYVFIMCLGNNAL